MNFLTFAAFFIASFVVTRAILHLARVRRAFVVLQHFDKLAPAAQNAQVDLWQARRAFVDGKKVMAASRVRGVIWALRQRGLDNVLLINSLDELCEEIDNA